MLGSPSEADDAVQEPWLRLSRTDAREAENLGGWLTTVVARVSLNMLRAPSRRSSTALPARSRPLDGVRFSAGAITVRGGKIVGIDILAADPERLCPARPDKSSTTDRLVEAAARAALDISTGVDIFMFVDTRASDE
jgi:DNA-directed RNA polymerase specialized sigma24 family protein